MNWVAQTLWDLLGKRKPTQRREPEFVTAQAGADRPAEPRNRPAGKSWMQQRYDALVAEMKAAYGIRIRKWRTSMSGCAWEVRYEDGRVVRLIEAPYPRGPMSCAVFLHEVGHHAIGLRTYKPRCLEEFKAWEWSVRTMRDKGFNVTPAVERRMAESLHYAVAKARRRGLKRLPVELVPYVDQPRPGRRQAG